METVGTGDWFYNSAKGLERPAISAKGLERPATSAKGMEPPASSAEGLERPATSAKGLEYSLTSTKVPGHYTPPAKGPGRQAPPAKGPGRPAAAKVEEQRSAPAGGPGRPSTNPRILERPTMATKELIKPTMATEELVQPTISRKEQERPTMVAKKQDHPTMATKEQERPSTAARALGRPAAALKAVDYPACTQGPDRSSAAKGPERTVADSKVQERPFDPSKEASRSSTDTKALEDPPATSAVRSMPGKEGAMGKGRGVGKMERAEEGPVVRPVLNAEMIVGIKARVEEREEVTSSHRQVLDTIQPMAMMMSNKVKSSNTNTEARSRIHPFNKAQEKNNKSELVKKEFKKGNVNTKNVHHKEAKVAANNECTKGKTDMPEAVSPAGKKTGGRNVTEDVKAKKVEEEVKEPATKKVEEKVEKEPATKKGLPAWMEKMERQLGMMSIDQLANF